MLRRSLKVVLLGMALLLILLVGAWALLQTPPAKRGLASLAGSLASTPDAGVRIEGIQGLLPFDTQVGQVTLTDGKGPWLEISQARLALRAGDLLRGRLTVEVLSAERVAVLRAPEGAAQEADTADGEPFSWPQRLPPVAIERLSIPELALAAPLLGQAVTFKVEGSALPSEALDAATVALDIQRTDQPNAALKLNAGLDLARRTLDLDLDGQETGGLTAQLLQRPDAGDARIRLNGRGPLQGWRGRLDAGVERLGELTGDLTLALDPVPAAELDLVLAMQDGALPPDFAGLVGPRATLSGHVRQPSDGQVEVTGLVLETGIARIEGQGTLSGPAQDVTATLRAESADIGPASALATLPLSGRASIAIDVTGSLERPQVKASLETTDLGVDQTRLARAAFDLTASYAADSPIPFTLSGHAEDLSQPGVPQTIGRIELDAAGHAGLEPSVALDRLRLALPEQAAELDGTASLAAAGALAGRLELRLADLARLEALAGLPLAGRLEAVVEPGGTLERPEARLDVTGSDLAQGGQTIGSLRLQGNVTQEGATMLAKVQLDAGADEARLTLDADLRLAAERLEVQTFVLKGPKLEADGKLEVALPSGLASGSVRAKSADLAALRPYLPEPVQGSLDLVAELSADQGRQDVTAKVEAKGISGSFGHLGSLQANAQGRDVLGTGHLVADLRLAGFSRPDLAIDQATVTADGPMASLPLRATARGQQAQNAFDLAASARLAVMGTPRTVALDSLKGQWASQPIELMAPATLTLAPGSIDLTQLDLRLGGIRARTRANLSEGRVKASAELDTMDIKALMPFGGPNLPGRVGGKATIDGAAAQPDVRVTIDLSGLRAPDRATGPTATAAVRANIVGGRRLETEATLRGFGAQPTVLSAKVPLHLSLEPFAFDLPKDGALTGTLAGVIDLARVAGYLPLDGQQLAGRLTLALGLAGTPASPQLTGQADLAAGRVTDAQTGFLLRDLKAALRTRDGKLFIDSLSGSDRRQGTLTAKGELTASPLAYKVEATTKTLEVVRSDIGQVSLSGDARIEGDPTAVTVWSRLTVGRAEIRIPEPAGSPPATIAVREIGKGAPPPPAEPAVPPAPPVPVTLDVTVTLPQGSTFLRGRGLDSEWKGSVAATGEAANPDVTGKIELVRGTLDFLGTNFTLDTGSITFDGAKPPMPRVDLVASAQKTDLKAIIHIVGRAPKPDINFESDPSRPRDDILAQILFNKNISSISPFEAASLANAVAQLQGGGIDTLGKLRSLAGLDTLGVGGGTEGEDPNARAGKYINDKVYLEVQQGLTPESGKARVEVDLGYSLKGTTEVRQTGQTGVGLLWQHDY